MDITNSFTPIYMELREKLETDILNSGLSEGSFYSTLKGICDKYDVSITTARKAIDFLVKAEVVKCKPSRGVFVGYTKNLLNTRSLKNFILILHTHPEGGLSTYFSFRLCAMLQVFSENGMTAKVISQDMNFFENLHISSGSLKGIVSSSHLINRELLTRYSQKVPVFLFDDKWKDIDGIYSVIYDTKEMTSMAIKYFRSKNIREIILIHHDSKELEEYAALLEQKNTIKFSCLKAFDNTVQSGRELVARLTNISTSVGFWVLDDFIAIGITEGFLLQGKDIRQDHRLLANGNPRLAYTQQLNIPVIGWDPWKLGTKAAEFLCHIIKNGNSSNSGMLVKPEKSF
jgi:DNA-binding LacI/PurR family transcriptional regulator